MSTLGFFGSGPREKVYVIACAEARAFKVGHSTRPKRRLADLQQACPLPLTLVVHFTGNYGTERELHRALAAWRMHGEWFQLNEDSIAALCTWLAGKRGRWARTATDRLSKLLTRQEAPKRAVRASK